MKNTRNQLGRASPYLAVALGAGFLGSTVSAQEFVPEVFVSGNGDFSFTEVQVFDDVAYYVNVLSGGSLGAAAFSFESDAAVGGGEPGDGGGPLDGPGDGPGGPAGPDFSGFAVFAPWSVVFLSETAWDAGVNIQVGSGVRSTTDLGSFDSLFGLLDNHVVLFSDVSGGNELTEDNDLDGSPLSAIDGFPLEPHFVRSQGEASTNGLFFDESGVVVGTTIPEPTTGFLVGLGATVLLARRRKS